VSPSLFLAVPPLAWLAYACGAHCFMGSAIRRGPGNRRRVALTFDDGPDPTYTSQLLRLLDRSGVRATFFLIGERAIKARDVVSSLIADGHEVGNHTWSHKHLWVCTPRQTEAEIVRGASAIGEVGGAAPRYFRPPWGMVNLAVFPVLRRLGTPCVLWSVQPEGLRPCPPQLMVERVIQGVRPGAIVDLHDADGVPGAGARLIEALPAMIDRLRQAGYELVPLGELLRAA
jgi:peptidoglycan/xylan/chitin deacetylase (PgdA/CDA1 family)